MKKFDIINHVDASTVKINRTYLPLNFYMFLLKFVIKCKYGA